MAVPDSVRLHGSCRCIEHMTTGSHLRGRCRCIEHMATCSHLPLRHEHLDIRDHVHVDDARSILGRKELGGDCLEVASDVSIAVSSPVCLRGSLAAPDWFGDCERVNRPLHRCSRNN